MNVVNLERSLASLGDSPRFQSRIASRWIQPWNLDFADAGRMWKWLQLSRASSVVETGTFEGIGTDMLAAAMQSHGGGSLTTFDFAGDFDNLSVVREQWADLAKIRAENLETIRKRYPGVALRYVDGDTRETVPTAQFENPVQFWFQDTMHFLEGIVAEIEAMEPALSSGAVIVFDDINPTHPFNKWVRENRSTWYVHRFEGGHGQLWAQLPY